MANAYPAFVFSEDDIQNQMQVIFNTPVSSHYIIVIGFSLNDFDGHIVREFRKVRMKRGVGLKIVNPDKNVLMRYQGIFPLANVSKLFDSFSEYCHWLTQQSFVVCLVFRERPATSFGITTAFALPPFILKACK